MRLGSSRLNRAMPMRVWFPNSAENILSLDIGRRVRLPEAQSWCREGDRGLV
jgi:hypothetical protein